MRSTDLWKRVVDGADRTFPTRQHELDRSYRSSLEHQLIGHQAGIDDLSRHVEKRHVTFSLHLEGA